MFDINIWHHNSYTDWIIDMKKEVVATARGTNTKVQIASIMKQHDVFSISLLSELNIRCRYGEWMSSASSHWLTVCISFRWTIMQANVSESNRLATTICLNLSHFCLTGRVISHPSHAYHNCKWTSLTWILSTLNFLFGVNLQTIVKICQGLWYDIT